jgi:CHAT domain-containing protein
MNHRILVALLLILLNFPLLGQKKDQNKITQLDQASREALTKKKSKEAYKLAVELEKLALSKKVYRSYVAACNYQYYAFRQLGEVDKGLEKLKEAAEYVGQKYERSHMTVFEAYNQYASALVANARNCEEVIQIGIDNLAAYCNSELSDTFDLAYLESIPKMEYKHNTWALKALRLMREANYCLCKDNPNEDCQTKQLAISLAAYNLIERVKADIHPKLVKKQVFKVTTPYAEKGLDAVDWLIKNTQDETVLQYALEFVEQNKSAMLMEAFQSQTAASLAQIPEALAKREDAFEARSNQIFQLFNQVGTADQRDSLIRVWKALNQQNNIFKDSLKANYPEYFNLRFNLGVVSAKQIQASLNEEMALFEYYLGEEALYKVCLTKNNIDYQKIPLNAKEFRNKIASFHKVLSDYASIKKNPKESFNNLNQYGQELYEILLGKQLEELKGIKHLIIVPDAEISFIPFEALIHKKTEGKLDFKNLAYLINDYKMQYAYSASLFIKKVSTTRPDAVKSMLAVAAYYGDDLKTKSAATNRSPEYDQLRKALDPLPAARKEIEVLAEKFEGAFWFDGEATEKNFKAKAEHYQIIHLAMHGLLNPKNPSLSSLAFTEDGDPDEDNFLEAKEIATLQLNAELVVLSACETGYGKFEQGEGVMSMARAFMYAGVPTLVVSLWQVNDASTSQIMQLFYHNLAKGMDKAEALRQAKISYIQAINSSLAAHPAFWSAFVLMGDQSPMELKEQSQGIGYFWYVGAAILLALIAGLWFWTRRRKAV